MLNVMTVVGTRPEIIRLSRLIEKLDRFTDHTLVHTGQNYDYELNEVFFSDLGIRKPDHFLNAAGETAGFLFGPERTGLDNDDVALADAILTEDNSVLRDLTAEDLDRLLS